MGGLEGEELRCQLGGLLLAQVIVTSTPPPGKAPHTARPSLGDFEKTNFSPPAKTPDREQIRVHYDPVTWMGALPYSAV